MHNFYKAQFKKQGTSCRNRYFLFKSQCLYKPGKGIALVDDVIQSGSSLQAIVKILTEQYGIKRRDITITKLVIINFVFFNST